MSLSNDPFKFNQGINHNQHDLKVYFKEDPGLWSNWRSIIGAN